ncbi:MAG: PAS domain-containing protein [Jatrophihabitans sp.]|uniref:PAS domain-containing protein n=1 Tax=Jatrophihabitans sp. TaxID=1932789 RepID=UPI003916923C
MQSTNEELETMNEELQSMNDELQATNEELRERTSEISSLNDFMESILGSLDAAVIVLDRDHVVRVWNRHAEDLWGLREDETLGAHFLNLDSGLPTEQLKPLIGDVLHGEDPAAELKLDAINRRGRSIALRVTVTPLRSDSDAPTGVLVLMEQPPPRSDTDATAPGSEKRGFDGPDSG